MIFGVGIFWLTNGCHCFRNNLKTSTRTIISFSSSTIFKNANSRQNYRIKWRKWPKSERNSWLNICFRTIYQSPKSESNKNTALIITTLVVVVLGLSYAAVPLYRIYCQKTGTSLQAVSKVDELNQKVADMKKVEKRKIRVLFDAETSARLAWNFKPTQHSLVCSPGETVLAFYTAKNVLDRPVNGIATYTILPYEAGKYFNKIQCFCFEEQQLNANEEVDLPVFFFIDPEYANDPYLVNIDEIILSYNFFETKEGFKLPHIPGFKAHVPIIDKNSTVG